MLKQIILLVVLFCSVALYGQNDYVLEKRDTGILSYYKIESPDAWEQRNAFDSTPRTSKNGRSKNYVIRSFCI